MGILIDTKTQIRYILRHTFNTIFYILFPLFLRRTLCKVAGFRIGKNTSLHSIRFFGFGNLIIGNNCIINSNVYLDNRCGIKIGNNVVIAHDSKIYTLGHIIDNENFSLQGKPVVVEDYCIIFSNALIMPGVTVGKGAVVLPGAVVTKSVGEMEIVGGNPAKVIKHRKILHHSKNVKHYWFGI